MHTACSCHVAGAASQFDPPPQPLQGLMGLSKLKELNLSKCEIVKLPESFGDGFHSLTTLNLSSNHMFLLPEKFTRMTSLTRLELSHMRLISLATVPAVSIPGEQVEDLGDLREWHEVRLAASLHNAPCAAVATTVCSLTTVSSVCQSVCVRWRTRTATRCSSTASAICCAVSCHITRSLRSLMRNKHWEAPSAASLMEAGTKRMTTLKLRLHLEATARRSTMLWQARPAQRLLLTISASGNLPVTKVLLGDAWGGGSTQHPYALWVLLPISRPDTGKRIWRHTDTGAVSTTNPTTVDARLHLDFSKLRGGSGSAPDGGQDGTDVSTAGIWNATAPGAAPGMSEGAAVGGTAAGDVAGQLSEALVVAATEPKKKRKTNQDPAEVMARKKALLAQGKGAWEIGYDKEVDSVRAV